MKRNNFIYLFSVWILLYSCKEKKNSFDESFSKKNNYSLPNLIITTNKSCNNLILKGNVSYFSNEYVLSRKLYINDSVYTYSDNNKVLFDLSDKKKTGFLELNKEISLKVNFLMDMNSNNQKFRLFEIKNISKYYSLNLSQIYIVNYNYGIVGQFLYGYENGEKVAISPIGFIPNQEHFYQIFSRAKLE